MTGLSLSKQQNGKHIEASKSGKIHQLYKSDNKFHNRCVVEHIFIFIFRLWEKAIALQNEPVPERNHFVDRIRTMV